MSRSSAAVGWYGRTFVVAALLAANGAAAQDAPLRLATAPALGPDLQAFPRIVEGASDQVAQRIHRALAQNEAAVRRAAKTCRDEAKPREGSWNRTVSVPMQGPRYLALLAADEWYCGGPYRDTSTLALVYDLRTGAPVNWVRLLPPALVQGTGSYTRADGLRVGTVSSPRLTDLYVKAAEQALDAQCKDALDGERLAFQLWPDARHGAIALKPSGLPHVITACGPEARVSAATLRSFGVDPGLLSAIEAGHRRSTGGR
jgi:hypothetical protein